MTEPVIAAREPIEVEVRANRKYWWCACGRSAKQPFCDGSHKDTDFTPVMYESPEDTKVWFCRCKNTGNRPQCDGTHNTL